MEQSIYIIKYFESMPWGEDMGIDELCFTTYEEASARAEQDEYVSSGEYRYIIRELKLQTKESQ